MGKAGKGKILVSCSLPMAWCADIDHRASALNLTRAAYLRAIVQTWRKNGMPAISEPDRLMQVASKAKKG